MTLREITEDWAAQHPRILHDPNANKRFHLIENGFSRVADFTRSLGENESPCILWDLMDDGYSYDEEGKLSIKRIIYFCAQADEGTNLPDSMPSVERAIAECHKLVNEFRNYIRKEQDKDHPRKDFMGIDLAWDVFPYGPLYNGWYSVGVTIDSVETVNLCEDPIEQ